jgi:histidinol-phosphate/aromatic aminotransferase/cobyric acid decarboxylase-like protein
VGRIIWLDPRKGTITEDQAKKYNVKVEATYSYDQRQDLLQDLVQSYGVHTPNNPTGILHTIEARGNFENLLEQVEASLLRPVPFVHASDRSGL